MKDFAAMAMAMALGRFDAPGMMFFPPLARAARGNLFHVA